jgi:hypothetical protein
LPFSAYGEAVMLLAQNLLLLALIYKFAHVSMARVTLVTSLLAAGIGVILSGDCPPASLRPLRRGRASLRMVTWVWRPWPAGWMAGVGRAARSGTPAVGRGPQQPNGVMHHV